MTDSNYNHGKHRKGMLLVHVVFVTKYRRTCLVDEYADTCKQVLRDSAQKLGIEVKEIEIDKDHVLSANRCYQHNSKTSKAGIDK